MWVWYIITNMSARMNHRKVGTDCVRMIRWWVSNVTNTVITFRCILGWFFCLFSVYFRPFLIPIWITISITNKRSQWISKWNSFLVNDQCYLNPSAKMLHCRAVIVHWYLSTLWNSNPVQLCLCKTFPEAKYGGKTCGPWETDERNSYSTHLSIFHF